MILLHRDVRILVIKREGKTVLVICIQFDKTP